jgi:serine/threonine-protein kinase
MVQSVRAPPLDRVGALIAGKYRVTRELGRGGMGVVVAAQDHRLGKDVAIKLLRADAIGSADAVRRFTHEARAVARLESHHVARVLDVGTEDGQPYLVMELLTGQDLKQLSRAKGDLPVADVVDYVLQAIDALAEAHRRGIVHRDLKPANLFLAEQADGTRSVKLLDFGVAKSASDASLTTTADVVGTPMYMSPEQVRASANVDGRSDIWSLGLVLFELLTGGHPFSRGAVGEIFAAILHEDIPRVSMLRGDLPPEFERVIHRCLERDPSARYANVAELAVALSPFGSGAGVSSVRRACRLLGAELAQNSSEQSSAASSQVSAIRARDDDGAKSIAPSDSKAEAVTERELREPSASSTPPSRVAPRRWQERAIAAVVLCGVVTCGAVLGWRHASRAGSSHVVASAGAPAALDQSSTAEVPASALPPAEAGSASLSAAVVDGSESTPAEPGAPAEPLRTTPSPGATVRARPTVRPWPPASARSAAPPPPAEVPNAKSPLLEGRD